MRQARAARTPLPKSPSAGSSNCWLCTHDADLARCAGSDRVDDLRDERAKVIDAVAPCADQHDGDRVRGKVLLELQVLVHRNEDLKLSGGLAQKRAVLETGPAESDDGMRVKRLQI